MWYVSCSPYGETIVRTFTLEADARTFASEVAALAGDYLTSWGLEPVNTVATVWEEPSAMPEPLTIIDARMPATVERWLDAWLTGTGRGTYLVTDSLRVVCGATGYLQTSESATQWGVTLTHADRAALVAYVVAWARAL